ncbi:MAG: hypothetical protein ABIL09_17950 [Gemmatimonadota bacterium]
MLWSGGFALFLLLVVALKYWGPRRERCPQCHAVREPDVPLCRECGWIYETPGDDDDYGEPESVESWN